MWPTIPSADALLADRLRRGWAPTPSPMADGPRVLGHAACALRGPHELDIAASLPGRSALEEGDMCPSELDS